MENMKGEDGLKDLKRLLNTPTEQHPEYSVDELMREHLDLLALAAALAQMETSVHLLTHDLKKTQRRVNALEQVFIPNFKDTLKFVRDSLESKELESIFVLKLVKTRLADAREKTP